jgi:hypothetical protein
MNAAGKKTHATQLYCVGRRNIKVPAAQLPR